MRILHTSDWHLGRRLCGRERRDEFERFLDWLTGVLTDEKIDALISSKKELAENVIGVGGESWITEMNNDELMDLLRLEV